jgi:hypothetical protein
MQIINGKRYDINRATILYNWNNRKLESDPDYLSESLYRKKTGEYFLYGIGGANTRYGVWEGVTGRAGYKIMPLTPAEARLWVESHATADEYAEIFSVSEKAPMRFNSVSPEIRQKMERIREETGKTLTEIFEEAIKEYQG